MKMGSMGLRGAIGALAMLSLSGCWWINKIVAGPPEAPPGTRLAAWRVGRLAVVPFADVTNQAVGAEVSRVFDDALRQSLGVDRMANELASAEPIDIGLIGVGQALRLGRRLNADGLVTGQVLAYQWQRRANRVLVSVSLRLLETSRGSIIWSRNATGVAQVSTSAAMPGGFATATRSAAKEFLDDLLARPVQAALGGSGARAPRRR